MSVTFEVIPVDSEEAYLDVYLNKKFVGCIRPIFYRRCTLNGGRYQYFSTKDKIHYAPYYDAAIWFTAWENLEDCKEYVRAVKYPKTSLSQLLTWLAK